MTETEFNLTAGAVLQRLEAALESSIVDCDCEWKGDGVLEVEFEDGARMVINRHGVAREIWVAARAGGFHFRPDPGQAGRWVDTRDGTELFAAVSRLVSQQTGQAVILSA